MHRFTAALLLTLFCATSAHAECSPQREQHLLAATLYREAEMARPFHASIMSVVLTRLKSGRYGRTICAVITSPNQFEYRLPKRPEGAKWKMAQESAHLFLNEYHGQGYISTEAHVFEKLRGYDSFVAAYSRKRAKKHYLTLGDNSFYRSGS